MLYSLYSLYSLYLLHLLFDLPLRASPSYWVYLPFPATDRVPTPIPTRASAVAIPTPFPRAHRCYTANDLFSAQWTCKEMGATTPCDTDLSAPTWWQLKWPISELNDVGINNPSPMCSTGDRRLLANSSWALALCATICALFCLVSWFAARRVWRDYYDAAALGGKGDLARLESSGSALQPIAFYDVTFYLDNPISLLARLLGPRTFGPKMMVTLHEKDFIRLQLAWLLLQARNGPDPSLGTLPKAWSTDLSATADAIPSVPLAKQRTELGDIVISPGR